MNEIIEIKELLDRYYEGESTDTDEQRLREYFTSDGLAAELQPYRSIFAYLQNEKVSTETTSVLLSIKNQKSLVQSKCEAKIASYSKWRYAAAAAVACLLLGTFFVHEYRPMPQTCTGTYIMINGICYNDLSLVKKYATETIDMVTNPISDGTATDAFNFLE